MSLYFGQEEMVDVFLSEYLRVDGDGLFGALGAKLVCDDGMI